MKLSIDKEKTVPVYLQISEQIKRQIFKGSLGDGYALPSERNLAAELGVHRNTVTKAYQDLKAEGLVFSCQGKGYRVSYVDKDQEIFQSKPVNWEGLTKDEYAVFENEFDKIYSKSFDSGIISFGGGVAGREVYPPEEAAEIFENIFKSGRDKAYFYTPFQGDPDLRKEISEFLKTKGIKADPGCIQIFSENNQSLDFILSLLLKPGDRVLMEDKTSPDVFRSFELAGAELIGVPMDEDGMICDNLETVIEKERPAFICVSASFHNPTGAVLPISRRKKLLELSYKYRIPIIEEDEGSELYYDVEPVPSIKSMDIGNNVIYMYSFSLTMMPGTGISFVVADRNVIRRFGEMLSLRVASTEWTAQMVTVNYMRSGLFHKHLEDFRKNYRHKRDLMCDEIDKFADEYGLEYRRPDGGVYLWIKLPAGLSARKLLHETQNLGMTFMPGHLFYTKKARGNDHIRLNYSYPTDKEIVEGVKILKKALAHEKSK
ncbi:MAG: PLP-dependent aminotransferase family protein [Bacillota bacterium]|nr:PLP-dependent aminotransferase family protein [Bacillota bacterium]